MNLFFKFFSKMIPLSALSKTMLAIGITMFVGCKKPIVAGPVDTALMQSEGIAMALASDDLEAAKKEAQRLITFLETYPEAPQQLASAAKAITESTDIEKARDGFTELSKETVPLAQGKKAFHIMHCPMTRQGYGKWVQVSKEISNPYAGAAMLRCGTIEQ